jgi:hypothetical protein
MAARQRRVAMGDPQAPFEKVKAILARHRLLGADGRLLPDVELTSMGDHFDWGPAETRSQAGADGRKLLEWLASHPPDQVSLVLGNHDLGRVGELAGFDDARFERIFSEAQPLYVAGVTETGDFHDRWPDVPTTECVARDFGTFQAAQRALVEALLRARRFRVAFAPTPELLLVHAGVTSDDLAGLGLGADEQRDATKVARALNAALDRALEAWKKGPLVIPGLHHPGTAAFGEGRGIFYHRPELPWLRAKGGEPPDDFAGPLRRRFDPRRLPRGLTQAIGHIHDAKCRKLLAGWVRDEAAAKGPLRSLVVEGDVGSYRRGVGEPIGAAGSRMLFTDGGMLGAEVEDYELLDLDTLRPFQA